MTPLLKARWLPHAPDEHLEELVAVTQTALGAAWHKTKFKSRKSRVAFLQERRNTNNFRTNLVRQFHSAHGGAWQVDKNEAAAFKMESPRRLVSEGLARGYPPYPHAEEAWSELRRRDDRGDAIRGLIVLPTGAGKTDVAVEWVLARLAAEEDLGVLWVAHQVALLEQAAARFQGRVLEQAVGLEKTLRIFCAGGDATTLLHPKHTDVALATIQTLSRGLGRAAKKKRSKQLAAYLARPTIVIIDEAHHAAARGYQLLLDFAADRELKDMLGLTATPWHWRVWLRSARTSWLAVVWRWSRLPAILSTSS